MKDWEVRLCSNWKNVRTYKIWYSTNWHHYVEKVYTYYFYIPKSSVLSTNKVRKWTTLFQYLLRWSEPRLCIS